MSRQTLILIFVTLLLLIGAILVSCVPTERADLVPAKAPGSNFYASIDNEGKLVLYVKNQGTGDAAASTTTVEFLYDPGQTVDLATPAIAAGDTVELAHTAIPGGCFNPDCSFRITVDSQEKITESSETNNTAEETIVG
jgi:subtilase family serine protease